jgi:hypothetical protein
MIEYRKKQREFKQRIAVLLMNPELSYDTIGEMVGGVSGSRVAQVRIELGLPRRIGIPVKARKAQAQAQAGVQGNPAPEAKKQ